MGFLRTIAFVGLGSDLAASSAGIAGNSIASTVYSYRNGVCDGNGYQNLGWSGMNEAKCIERAIETSSDGSCAFLSFAQSYNNGQTGCWCFKAHECQSLKMKPDGQDGDWRTLAISETIGSPSREPTPAPRTAAPTPASGTSISQMGWCTQGDRSNIAFGGMSRDQCLEEAKKRQKDNNGCPLASYSASTGPQQQNSFCQCIRTCEKGLIALSGEVWETLEVNSLMSGDTQTPTPSANTPAPTAPTPAVSTLPTPTPTSVPLIRPGSFLAPASAQSPSDLTAGWCTRGDRSNIAFGGMSRSQCLSEAKKRQQESSGCPLVSYSSSSGPQQQNKFCQCIRNCEVDLLSLDNEAWETLEVDDDLATDDGISFAASHVLGTVAFGVVFAANTFAMY